MMRLCTICARGGSKGVPGKNIRPLAGKPLIAHSIGQAIDAGIFDTIAVSSDSQEILDVAEAWGADVVVMRPPELATDTAAKLPAIRHCLTAVEVPLGAQFDTICDLDATSPLRSIDDIWGAVEALETRGVGNVITGAPSRHSPYFNMVERDDSGALHLAKASDKPIVRRQDAPQCYDMNASIYVWQRARLMAGGDSVLWPDTVLLTMPPERSFDIDAELDWRIVEFMLGGR